MLQSNMTINEGYIVFSNRNKYSVIPSRVLELNDTPKELYQLKLDHLEHEVIKNNPIVKIGAKIYRFFDLSNELYHTQIWKTIRAKAKEYRNYHFDKDINAEICLCDNNFLNEYGINLNTLGD